jgi:hypothetical protein
MRDLELVRVRYIYLLYPNLIVNLSVLAVILLRRQQHFSLHFLYQTADNIFYMNFRIFFDVIPPKGRCVR